VVFDGRHSKESFQNQRINIKSSESLTFFNGLNLILGIKTSSKDFESG
jgi:hypothetical protein